MKIAIITAGGAGMFCGSCMQDNTLARTLRNVGHDVTLIPTYTPITVDEENVSVDRVFLGGVNVYLDSTVPGWSRLPRFLKGWLDRPKILRRLTRRSSATDASQLGELTIDILKGNLGPQRDEIQHLVTWLVDDLKPNLILFSNALLSGVVPTLRQRFGGKIVCLLQGDDVFLDALSPSWKTASIDLISENIQHFDRLLTHSRWYADHISQSMGLPRERVEQIPLSIDCEIPDFTPDDHCNSPSKTIGYFARICPEKGIDNFLNAIDQLADTADALQFRIAGFLPELHRDWFHKRLTEVQRTIGPNRLQWLSSPRTRTEKFQILKSFDVLCVPANYHEPKGLFMLEAALVGVPSLVPDHGAFPDRINDLAQGWTYPADSQDALCQAIRTASTATTSRMSEQLQQSVRRKFSMNVTGPILSQVLQDIVNEQQITQSPS